MNKINYTFKFILLVCMFFMYSERTYSQSLTLVKFEKLLSLKSIEKQSDFLFENDFTKEKDTTSNSVSMSNFIKGNYTFENHRFDREAISLTEDVVTYFFKNPKDYIGFKKQLLARYKEGEFAEDTDNFATHYLYGKYKIVFNKFKNKMEDTGNEIETYCFTISFRK